MSAPERVRPVPQPAGLQAQMEPVSRVQALPEQGSREQALPVLQAPE